jgi:hypothetical protein
VIKGSVAIRIVRNMGPDREDPVAQIVAFEFMQDIRGADDIQRIVGTVGEPVRNDCIPGGIVVPALPASLAMNAASGRIGVETLEPLRVGGDGQQTESQECANK